MEWALINDKRATNQANNILSQILDSGIDDMEAGKELPMDEAFQKVTDLRNHRRNAKA